MKRHEWTFDIGARQLAQAAEAKVAQERVMAEVREKGLRRAAASRDVGEMGQGSLASRRAHPSEKWH